MIPIYHCKTKDQINRIGKTFTEVYSVLKAKNIPLVMPHQRFKIARDDDYAELEFFVKEDGHLGVVQFVSHEDSDAFFTEARAKGFVTGKMTQMSNEELYEAGKRASLQVGAGFCVMLEYGVFDIKTRKEKFNVIPMNRAERRQLTKEEAFHKWIEVRPHTHIKQRILKGIEEAERKSEPWFQQKVRSHIRRLSENRVTIVKEHKRYAHLPERPQVYNMSKMAQESLPCKVCL